MKDRIIINFFDCSINFEYIELLSDFLNIDFNDIFDFYLDKVFRVDLIDLITEFNIDLNKRLYKEILITCRHALTTCDNLKSILNRGLTDLKTVLSVETPLKDFLDMHHISIDVNGKVLSFDTNVYPILKREEKCTRCIYNECRCIDYCTKQPSYKRCSYRKELSILHTKLYKDKCELEVFIDGTIEDIESYSVISECPEILETLDNVLSKLQHNINLHTLWRKQDNNKFYILEFDTNIYNLERMGKIDDFTYDEISDILEYFDYDYTDFLESKINEIFLVNLYIVQYLNYRAEGCKPEKFGQIYHGITIMPNELRVVKEKKVN